MDWSIKRAEGGRMKHAFGVDWDMGVVAVGDAQGKMGLFSLETGKELEGECRNGKVVNMGNGGLWVGKGARWDLWDVEDSGGGVIHRKYAY